MSGPRTHALLKQEEEPSPRVTELGLHLAFGILDCALNRKASRRDPSVSSEGEHVPGVLPPADSIGFPHEPTRLVEIKNFTLRSTSE